MRNMAKKEKPKMLQIYETFSDESGKISPGVAARFIECSEREVYRWVQGINTPSMIYRKAIRHGIRRIKENF